MKAHLKKTLALAILAATLPAQTTDYAAALQRAELIERQEGDLGAAQLAYEALLDADAVPQAVHTVAQFNLGSLLWRLGKRDEARQILDTVVAADGAFAVAAVALLQSESQEAQGEQERVARARAIIKRYAELIAQQPVTTYDTSNLETELGQLGKAAAQAITEELNVALIVRNNGRGLNAGDQPVLAWLARHLWQIGTKPAQKFFADVAERGPLPWQRFLISNAVKQGSSIAPDLTAAVLQFTQTNDPTRETWRYAQACLHHLPIAAVTECLKSENPATREAGLVTLTHFVSQNARIRATYVRDHRATVANALDYSTPQLRDATWKLLSQFLLSGPHEGTTLFLEEAKSRPTDTPSLGRVRAIANGDDAWLHQVVETARALGAVTKYEERPLHSAVRQLVVLHKPQWTAAALPDVETLVQLGYVRGQAFATSKSTWLEHYVKLASPAQRAALLLQLPEMAGVQRMANAMMRHDPTPELLPAIEQVLAQCTPNAEINWIKHANKDSRSEIYWLAYLAGHCGHPDAGRVISEFTTRHPKFVMSTYPMLCTLSMKRADVSARAALRKLLAMSPSENSSITKAARNTIFAELVRAGDTLAIPLLSQAYEWGLETKGFNYLQLQPYSAHPTPQQSVLYAGINLLNNANGGSSVHHNYAPADLLKAWELIFAGNARETAWNDLTARGSARAPVAALPVFGKQLLARWQDDQDDTSKNLLGRAIHAFNDVRPETLAASAELRTTIHALITAPQRELGSRVFHSLHDATALEFAAAALEQFRSSKDRLWFGALVHQKIPLGTDDWLAALSGDRDTKKTALQGLPKDVDEAVTSAVEALLADPDPTARRTAAGALSRIVGTDAVPLLLPLLQDESDHVVKGVRTLLAQMREEQEQRNFWARVGGIELTPASAAAKLIHQAMPAEAKEQRLLAIRSLALLNTPESLPYLIDWTKDEDTDIQAAAKQAIADIHQKGAAIEAPKKK